MAVMSILAYTVFLVLVAYASYKTRNKITEVADRIKKK